MRTVSLVVCFVFGTLLGAVVKPAGTRLEETRDRYDTIVLHYPLAGGGTREMILKVEGYTTEQDARAPWRVSLIDTAGKRVVLCVHPLDRVPGALPPDAAAD